MLETWMEWKRQYIQVSSIAPQVNTVIFLHTHYPTGLLNLCGYKQDRNSFKHGPSLPDAVIAKVKLVYQRLS